MANGVDIGQEQILNVSMTQTLICSDHVNGVHVIIIWLRNRELILVVSCLYVCFVCIKMSLPYSAMGLG